MITDRCDFFRNARVRGEKRGRNESVRHCIIIAAGQECPRKDEDAVGRGRTPCPSSETRPAPGISKEADDAGG